MTSRTATAFSMAFLAVFWSTLDTAAAEPTDANITTAAVETLAGDAGAVILPTPAAHNGVNRSPAPPAVYVIVDGSRTGDTVCRMDWRPDATVGSVLRKAYYAQPVNLASARIAIHRTKNFVEDDLSVTTNEEILAVKWDATANQPTAKTNYRLTPSDRVIVTLLAPEPALVEAPSLTPMAAGFAAAALNEHAPSLLPASPQPITANARSSIRYSAIPEAVPSPFSNDQPSDAVVPAPVYAPQAFATESESGEPSKVRFEISVVEDAEDNLTEFEQLRSDMPFMLVDSSTIRGTLRILKKHKLVRQLYAPKLMTVAGKTATMESGAPSNDPAEPWQGLKLNVTGHELGGGMAVEFAFENTAGRQINEVQTRLIVPYGQSVLMKTGASQTTAIDKDAADGRVERAVYVVLTPEIVK